jgi:hypothetical protein
MNEILGRLSSTVGAYRVWKTRGTQASATVVEGYALQPETTFDPRATEG